MQGAGLEVANLLHLPRLHCQKITRNPMESQQPGYLPVFEDAIKRHVLHTLQTASQVSAVRRSGCMKQALDRPNATMSVSGLPVFERV